MSQDRIKQLGASSGTELLAGTGGGGKERNPAGTHDLHKSFSFWPGAAGQLTNCSVPMTVSISPGIFSFLEPLPQLCSCCSVQQGQQLPDPQITTAAGLGCSTVSSSGDPEVLKASWLGTPSTPSPSLCVQGCQPCPPMEKGGAVLGKTAIEIFNLNLTLNSLTSFSTRELGNKDIQSCRKVMLDAGENSTQHWGLHPPHPWASAPSSRAHRAIPIQIRGIQGTAHVAQHGNTCGNVLCNTLAALSPGFKSWGHTNSAFQGKQNELYTALCGS